MPIQTQLIRNGEPLVIPWGWWVVDCLAQAMEAEGLPRKDPGNGHYIYMGFPNMCHYTFKENHTFPYPEEAPTQAKNLEIKAGDEYHASR